MVFYVLAKRQQQALERFKKGKFTYDDLAQTPKRSRHFNVYEISIKTYKPIKLHQRKQISGECVWCSKSLQRMRSDSKFCNYSCRYQWKAENAKFEVVSIPKSGHKGITFNRVHKSWELRDLKQRPSKYLGSFPDVESAVKFKKEYEDA